MRALISEDDQTIADFVGRGLRESGFAVDRAADGDEGLEAALQQPYDVAIVDLMLPKRERLSVIRTLRGRWPLRGRSRPRPPGRGRRLPHETVCLRGAPGTRAGAGPPREPLARADHP